MESETDVPGERWDIMAGLVRLLLLWLCCLGVLLQLPAALQTAVMLHYWRTGGTDSSQLQETSG